MSPEDKALVVLFVLAPFALYGWCVFYDRHIAPRITRLVYWLAGMEAPRR